MSEHIQNDSYKQEKLKEIIRRLHAGEPVARVRKDFDVLIKNVSAEEIAAMEQALISEGFPVEEVQRLCEVHVQVFQKSLERQGREERLPGHPVYSFQEENREARTRIKPLRRLARRMAWFPRAGNAARELGRALDDFEAYFLHYTRKENQLFPHLEKHGFSGPSKVMWGKHDEARDQFRQARAALERSDFKAAARAALAFTGKARTLMFMEERILFPTALRMLAPGEWAAIRRGEGEIGYAWIKPGAAWDADLVAARGMSATLEAAAGAAKPAQAAPDGAIDLDTGRLLPEQIDMMLKALPLDLSFVDENDRVLYYSGSPERIFPRSPAIIGREVQNCHPHKSVHIVNRIIEAFRKKERSSADFWIEMKGRFIHIRYLPLYDRDGRYRGVLEMSQDATGIRALEGERRLLDWV